MGFQDDLRAHRLAFMMPLLNMMVYPAFTHITEFVLVGSNQYVIHKIIFSGRFDNGTPQHLVTCDTIGLSNISSFTEPG
jgi:hypothetical protein